MKDQTEAHQNSPTVRENIEDWDGLVNLDIGPIESSGAFHRQKTVDCLCLHPRKTSPATRAGSMRTRARPCRRAPEGLVLIREPISTVPMLAPIVSSCYDTQTGMPR